MRLSANIHERGSGLSPCACELVSGPQGVRPPAKLEGILETMQCANEARAPSLFESFQLQSAQSEHGSQVVEIALVPIWHGPI